MRELTLSPGHVRTQRLLEMAHQHVGLELAFVAEFDQDRQVTRFVAGDPQPFGLAVGDGPDLPTTYCTRMVAGDIPNVIPDTSADTRVAQLPITRSAGIGAYIGVPLYLADGTVYGSFCCLGSEADPTLDDRSLRFMSMLGELMAEDLDLERTRQRERAEIAGLIAAGSMRVACQPIIDLRDDRVVGLEALARFPAPYDRPDRAFATAHALGHDLGVELELFSVTRALELVPQLNADQYLSINLSPAVVCELSQHGPAPDRLALRQVVLELTEHAMVDDYSQLQRDLAPYREQGLRVSVDDAGAGYASLHHIVELAPDFIKVDRSLVDGLAHDRARRVTVTGFVLLALELGCTVIAEGVRERADLEALCDIGVDAAQGYLLGPPSDSAAQLAAWTS